MFQTLYRLPAVLALCLPTLALGQECSVNFGSAPAVNTFTSVNAGTTGAVDTCFNFELLAGEAFRVTLTASTFSDISSLEFRSPAGLIGSFSQPTVGTVFAWSNVPVGGLYRVDFSAAGPQFSFASFEVSQFLAPIPEPETYALMLAGLAMVAAFARRRPT